jgi:hypothetical protein
MQGGDVGRLLAEAAVSFVDAGDLVATVEVCEALSGLTRGRSAEEIKEGGSALAAGILNEEQLEKVLTLLVKTPGGIRAAAPLARRLLDLIASAGADPPSSLLVRLRTIARMAQEG